MTALSAPVETGRKDGNVVRYNVAAGQTIYKGALLVTRLDGYAYNLRTPAASQTDVFIGVADESVDNSAGASGAQTIQVIKGTFKLSMASATIAAIGTLVYGADNATVASTSTNAVAVGYVTEYVDSSSVRVAINRSAQ